MISITRKSFWIYFSVCVILFALNLFISPRSVADMALPAAIAIGIFVDILLEIIRQRQVESDYLMGYICYGFEAASAASFAIIVFGKLLFP